MTSTKRFEKVYTSHKITLLGCLHQELNPYDNFHRCSDDIKKLCGRFDNNIKVMIFFYISGNKEITLPPINMK